MKANVRSFTKGMFGRRLRPVAIAAILSVVAAGALQAMQASPRTLTFSDPVGDQLGSIDVTGMVITFKQNNGAYTIVLTADAAHPFTGQFRVSINLYNPSAPAGQSVFQDL